MSFSGQLARHARLVLESRPDDPLARRDPEFIRAEMELLGSFTDAWYSPDVIDFDKLPDGPSLVVGTHNGGIMAPDMFVTMVAFWRRFGVERPAYGLAHDMPLKAPVVGRFIAKLGAVPAHRDNARALLARGATVLVYPGGDIDAFKPFAARHRVEFGERLGFVRTALEAGVPIVPVVSVGAHETFYVVTDGRELARRIGLKRFTRIEVLPLTLCLPWGLWVGPYLMHLPAPSRIRVRMLDPIRFAPGPVDEARLREVRDSVRSTMQRALDDLVAEGGFGPSARI
jgi:1-acyl-sn-glycerol-3-phosphate acyltransferase